MRVVEIKSSSIGGNPKVGKREVELERIGGEAVEQRAVNVGGRRSDLRVGGGGGGDGVGGVALGALVLAAAAADGDVAEGAASGPVALAGFAKVSRLRQAVVVVVTKLGIGGIAARALERVRIGLIWFLRDRGHSFIC